MRQMKWLTPFILIIATIFILSACGILPEKPTGLDDTESEQIKESKTADKINKEQSLVAADEETDSSEKEANKESKEEDKSKRDNKKSDNRSDKEKDVSDDNSEQKSSDTSEKSENKKTQKDKASNKQESEKKSTQKDKSRTTQKSESKKEQKNKSSTDKKSASKDNSKSELKKKENTTKKEDKPKKNEENKEGKESTDDSDSNKDEAEDPKSTIVHSIVISSNEVPLPATELEIEDGDTVLDALIAITMKHKVHMDYRGGQGATAYVQGMGNVYEFDRGSGSGWMYSVNGIFPDRGAGVVPLMGGDRVEWVYTTNLGEDLNANLKPFRR